MEEEHQVFAKEELVDSFGFRHPFLPTFRLQSLIQQKKTILRQSLSALMSAANTRRFSRDNDVIIELERGPDVITSVLAQRQMSSSKFTSHT